MAAFQAANESQSGRDEGPQGCSERQKGVGPGSESLMSETALRGFDCIRLVREVRARNDEETKDMSWEEYRRWLDSRRPKHPVGRRMGLNQAPRRQKDADDTDGRVTTSGPPARVVGPGNAPERTAKCRSFSTILLEELEKGARPGSPGPRLCAPRAHRAARIPENRARSRSAIH